VLRPGPERSADRGARTGGGPLRQLSRAGEAGSGAEAWVGLAAARLRATLRVRGRTRRVGHSAPAALVVYATHRASPTTVRPPPRAGGTRRCAAAAYPTVRGVAGRRVGHSAPIGFGC